MQSDKYFQKLGKSIGSKIPQFIVNILKETGYDTEIALRELGECYISEIEKYMDSHRSVLAGTVYENKEEIKLLPGHKAIILSIPAYITKNLSNTKGAKKEKKEIKQPVDNIAPQIVTKVKKLLVEKIRSTLSKIKLSLESKDEYISELIFYSDINASCRYACPACSKVLKCLFIKHWKISNLQSHFKEHCDEAVTVPLVPLVPFVPLVSIVNNIDEIDEMLTNANNIINKPC